MGDRRAGGEHVRERRRPARSTRPAAGRRRCGCGALIVAHVCVVTGGPEAATVFDREWRHLEDVRRDEIRGRRDAYERALPRPHRGRHRERRVRRGRPVDRVGLPADRPQRRRHVVPPGRPPLAAELADAYARPRAAIRSRAPSHDRSARARARAAARGAARPRLQRRRAAARRRLRRVRRPRRRPAARSSRPTGCPTSTGGRAAVRRDARELASSWACSPSATGSCARRRCAGSSR